MSTSLIKKRIFYVIATLLPLAMLAIVELGLRAIGYGTDNPVFVEAKGRPNYLTANPDLIKRFFHIGAPTPTISPDTDYFLKTKPQNSLRLVLMGGSTAAGFPYGRFGSPSAMVKQQLIRLYPDKHIDVINIAMSSVNSYTLRDIAKDVALIEPDAVLIYAGHNEYLGVMGAGSVLSGSGNHLTNLAFLSLKQVRLFQLLQSLWQSETPLPTGEGRSLMAQLAQTQAIPENSATYAAGVRQFDDNIQAVIRTFEERGIPVVISNIVANEKDQTPFLSLPSKALPTSCKQNPTDFHRSNASALFFTAQCYLASGDTKAAKMWFREAVNKDQLRFRAHEDINVVIESKIDEQAVFLADTQERFEAHSPAGIVGNELMLEHLHPNSEGYSLIAQSFIAGLQEARVIGREVPESFFRQDWSKYTLSPVDHVIARQKIRRLTSDYPFQSSPVIVSPIKPSSPITTFAITRENGQPWLSQQPELLDYFAEQGDVAAMARTAAMLFDALPWEHKTAHTAATLLLRAGDLHGAQYYVNQAIQLASNVENYWLTRAEIHFKQGNKSKALEDLKTVLMINPNNKKAPGYIRLISSS